MKEDHGNPDPLKHYAPIQLLKSYKEDYQYSDFVILRPDCDGGYFIDIAFAADQIPDDAVAFHILPENNW